MVIGCGQQTLLQIHKLIGRYSLIGDRPFFSPQQFPWHESLTSNWGTIRAELEEVLKKREHLPNIQVLSPDQAEITEGDNWKTFFFFAYGLTAEPNCRSCPETARLLKACPEPRSLSSRFSSRTRIFPSTAVPTKGRSNRAGF